MRVAAVSQMKGVRSGIPLMRERPAHGTLIGDLYERFMAAKGKPIELSTEYISPRMAALTDYYGLDIRLVQRANKRKGFKSTYVLAGEWFGKVYIDYIAERLQ
jgi:hypothetical protein